MYIYIYNCMYIHIYLYLLLFGWGLGFRVYVSAQVDRLSTGSLLDPGSEDAWANVSGSDGLGFRA